MSTLWEEYTVLAPGSFDAAEIFNVRMPSILLIRNAIVSGIRYMFAKIIAACSVLALPGDYVISGKQRKDSIIWLLTGETATTYS